MRTETILAIAMNIVAWFAWFAMIIYHTWRADRFDRERRQLKADVERLAGRLVVPEKELPPVKDGRYR